MKIWTEDGTVEIGNVPIVANVNIVVQNTEKFLTKVNK